MGIDNKNKISFKFLHNIEKWVNESKDCWNVFKNKKDRYSRGPRVSDTRYLRDQREVTISKQQSEIEMRHLPRSQYMVMWAVDWFKRYGR